MHQHRCSQRLFQDFGERAYLQRASSYVINVVMRLLPLDNSGVECRQLIGAKLARYIQERGGELPDLSTLHALVADFAATDTELVLPLKVLVAKQEFRTVVAKARSGESTIHLHALFQDLENTFAPKVIDALADVMNGFLGLDQSHNSEFISSETYAHRESERAILITQRGLSGLLPYSHVGQSFSHGMQIGTRDKPEGGKFNSGSAKRHIRTRELVKYALLAYALLWLVGFICNIYMYSGSVGRNIDPYSWIFTKDWAYNFSPANWLNMPIERFTKIYSFSTIPCSYLILRANRLGVDSLHILTGILSTYFVAFIALMLAGQLMEMHYGAQHYEIAFDLTTYAFMIYFLVPFSLSALIAKAFAKISLR